MPRITVFMLVMGLVGLGSGSFLLARPALFKSWMGRFPRSVWAARVLTAVDLIWVVTVMHHADFGSFNWIKDLLVRFIPALGPMPLGLFTFLKDPVVWAGVAAFFLITKYMDELLAVRALGGLLLLIANPILNAARWQDTNWRWLPALLAYLIVIKGLFFVMSPYTFRRWNEKYLQDASGCRRFGTFGLAASLFIMGVGWLAF